MKTTPNIKIAIADDHKLVREGICMLISGFENMSVIIEASDGGELVETLSKCHELPDVCILDINMPVLNGYDTLLIINERWPTIKTLVLTMFDHEYTLLYMLKKGANGFLLKNCSSQELNQALRAVYNNELYHYNLTSKALVEMLRHEKEYYVQLNEKERQFLKLCCSDLKYSEIADVMHLGARTIEGYRDALFKKLNVKHRVGLAMFAIQTGLT